MNEHSNKTYTYDVCIVGAGLTGSAAARWTSLQKDVKVCLIGPNEPTEDEWSDPSRTIFGAHYDQGRVVSEVKAVARNDESWLTLFRRSRPRFRELERQSGMQIYKEVGNVLMSNEDFVDEIWQKSSEIASVERFRGDELPGVLASFKPLDDRMDALYEHSGAGYINPRSYIAANKLLASRSGCEIIEDVVTEVRSSEGEYDDHDDDDEGNDGGAGSQLLNVRTKSGREIRTGRVLLCPGAFVNFDHLLPNGMEVDVSTTTERVVLLEVPDDDVERLSAIPCCTLSSKSRRDQRNTYFLPAIKYADGKYYVKVGHGQDLNKPLTSHQDITAWYRKRGDISPTVIRNLVSRLFKILKEFEPKSLKAMTCVITTTPTGRFYCDMATSNIGVIVGGNGSGSYIADEIGRMGAQMIVKGAWDYDLPAELFRLKFKDGRARDSALTSKL